MYSCKNCKWEGEKLSEKPLVGKCPICGDEVSLQGEKKAEAKAVEKKFDAADVNKDGKVDIKDAVAVVKRFGKKRK